jgi:hypothetical protein
MFGAESEKLHDVALARRVEGRCELGGFRGCEEVRNNLIDWQGWSERHGWEASLAELAEE